MYCAKLKEVLKLKQEFLYKWGLKQLKEDYETATKNLHK